MYTCPHCGRQGVGFIAKWLSFPAMPARCKLCKCLSFAPSSKSGQLLVFNCLLLTLAGFAGVFFHSLFPPAIAVILALFFWAFGLHRRPLVPVSAEQTLRARQAEGLGMILLLWLTGS